MRVGGETMAAEHGLEQGEGVLEGAVRGCERGEGRRQGAGDQQAHGLIAEGLDQRELTDQAEAVEGGAQGEGLARRGGGRARQQGREGAGEEQRGRGVGDGAGGDAGQVGLAAPHLVLGGAA